jgi:hypothetical protein
MWVLNFRAESAPFALDFSFVLFYQVEPVQQPATFSALGALTSNGVLLKAL